MYRSMYRSIYLSIYLSIYPSTPFWIFFARNMSTPGFLSKTTRGWRKQKRKGAWPESESSCGVANQKTFQKGGPWENNVFCFFFKIRCLMWFVFFFFNLPFFVSLVFNSFEPCWFQLGFASNDQRDQSVHLYYARCSTIFLKTPKHTKTMSITSSSSS